MRLQTSCEVPGVPTIEFRASIVIGSGSLSFEMIRALVQRLPVMICPRWVAVKAQPIAVEDVDCLPDGALELPRWNSPRYLKSVAPTRSAMAKSCRSTRGNAACGDG